MESENYPDFIQDFVRGKLAAMDLQASEEKMLYITQDIEDWMLDAGRSVKDLSAIEKHHIDEFIRERL